jgi:hypothetical protein
MRRSIQLDSDALIELYCAQDDLSTYDPFDVWKSPLGFRLKNFHNHHRRLGFIPAAGLTVFDTFVNNRLRLFYRAQEFPIVRAWAAQILLNTYEHQQAEWALEYARKHLDWLCENSCRGYSGPCWGLGFNYAVDANLVYDANTPLSTMTPYALEAFVRYTAITGDSRYVNVLLGIYEFFEKDILIIEETDEYIVTSYAPMQDRRVVNAVSYSLYSYSLLLPYLDEPARDATTKKMRKLYAFIVKMQQDDGSWLYSPDSRSFIDCFHSCIILKNLIKTNQTFSLPGSQQILERGYDYVKSNFYVDEIKLFKRFSITYTPSLVRFDLYDNAEMLNLARLMQDDDLTESLCAAIDKWFVRGSDIYSQIDRFGLRRNKNMLRWAVMPYLYALS